MALDIILMAAIAAFIFLRLRSELGKKTGGEPLPPAAPRPVPTEQGQARVDAPSSGAIIDMENDPLLRKIYKDIRKQDPSFDPAAFREGAMNAYGMILEAFWAGDRDTLKELLDTSVFQQFSSAIDARIENKLTLENRLMDITDAKIVSGTLQNGTVELTVKFTAEIVAVTRDETGRVVEGDETDATETHDKWTFARQIMTDDPSWTLIATRAGE